MLAGSQPTGSECHIAGVLTDDRFQGGPSCRSKNQLLEDGVVAAENKQPYDQHDRASNRR